MASAAHEETVIAVHGDYELAEGGRWAGDRYVYVDILSGRLFELRDGTTGHAPRQLARLDVPLGVVAPVHGRPGTWIAAAGTRIALLGPDGDLEWLDRPVRFHGDEGSPDGMTVDDKGCLWVAVWGGSSVRRYPPDGRLLQTLALPATQPTSVCCIPGTHAS